MRIGPNFFDPFAPVEICTDLKKKFTVLFSTHGSYKITFLTLNLSLCAFCAYYSPSICVWNFEELKKHSNFVVSLSSRIIHLILYNCICRDLDRYIHVPLRWYGLCRYNNTNTSDLNDSTIKKGSCYPHSNPNQPHQQLLLMFSVLLFDYRIRNIV